VLEDLIEHAKAPLQRLEHELHPWVAYAIMPVFALANAGVVLGSGIAAGLTSPISLGIILGLVAGKQIGITLFSWLIVKSGLAELPEGVTWRHIYGVSWLAGIGFTMSLFISSLAFGGTAQLETAKFGILAASLIAGTTGYLILRYLASPQTATQAARA
jgi:Na+:H+ antiporter, NhaA family